MTGAANGRGAGGPSRATGGRRAAATAAASVVLLAAVALLGESAAVPGLGPPTALPPWDLAARPAPLLVTGLLVLAHGLGGWAVLQGLRAVRNGARPRPRRVAAAVALGVALLTVVPPLGSADHLSYAAYGRIAAEGDDPYDVAPVEWRGGTDPVASAVQPPWERTPSVYGPVATGAMALAAQVGDGRLRPTVWAWQLLCAASFLVVAWVLDRLARGDPALRARAAVLWAGNPLLLGHLVLGAHVDVVAAALAVAGLALAARRPLVAGVLLGAAAGTKAPYALAALAVLWGIRHLPLRAAARHAALGLLGAGVVLVPGYLAAGPHVLDQLREASRFISIATPWRGLANLVDLAAGSGAARTVAAPLALVLAGLIAVPLWRRVSALTAAPVTAPDGEPRPGELRDRITGDAVRAAVVLSAAWVLTAPYALPWYDALVWAPLALVGPSLLDRALLARLVVLSLAYVPGRVVGLTPLVETLTLGFRRYVAPLLVLAVVVTVVRWALQGSAGGGRAGPRAAPPAAPAP